MANLAKQRWRLLSEIISNRKIEYSEDLAVVSVRRFSSFQLFVSEKLNTCDEYEHNSTSIEYKNGNCCDTTESCCRLHQSESLSMQKHSEPCDSLGKNEPVISGQTTREVESTGNEISEHSESKLLCGNDSKHAWFIYKSVHFPGLSVIIRHLSNKVLLNKLLDFNNTGNVCVWPSEEVLAYYCLKHADKFKMKSVCELGGGMTCLAIIMLASYIELSSALATDGNERSADNLQEIVERNCSNFKTRTITARLLRWDDQKSLSDIQGTYDFVICADCLFFDEYRQPLLQTILALLKSQGRAILLAPSRDGTFNKFITLVEACEHVKLVQVLHNYDDLIYQLHLQNVRSDDKFYDESLHYPKLIEILKL